MKGVTFIIKTFLRDSYLKLCVESIMKTYPEAKIMVADGGYTTDEKEKYYAKLRKSGVKVYHLPFDCGITFGRNFLVKRVKTPFVVIGDDDFLYTKETGVEKFVELLRNRKDLSLVGGSVIEVGEVKHYEGMIDHDFFDKSLKYTALELSDFNNAGGVNYKLCDITFNFMLVRRSVFDDCMWDNNIKVAYEHSDFFLELKRKQHKVAFTPDVIVEHKPTIANEPTTEQYKQYRYRNSDKDYFFSKWKLDYTIDMKGIKTLSR